MIQPETHRGKEGEHKGGNSYLSSLHSALGRLQYRPCAAACFHSLLKFNKAAVSLQEDKDIEEEEEEEEEEAVTAVSKEAKVKKIMSKKERREKKMFSSKDDEHFLLTGVKLADRRGSLKKIKDDEKEKEKKDKPEKGHCFWESVTMTMRQISPTKKLEKMEGWEPPHLENSTETVTDEAPEDKSWKGDSPVPFPDSVLPLELASWAGQGLEEDSSRYANLSDSKNSTAAIRWTARAKVKLAGISRMSRGIVSESAWEGFK